MRRSTLRRFGVSNPVGCPSGPACCLINQATLFTRQTTLHSSLIVGRQGDAYRNLSQAFLLVDTINFNFVDEERSGIHQAKQEVVYFISIF